MPGEPFSRGKLAYRSPHAQRRAELAFLPIQTREQMPEECAVIAFIICTGLLRCIIQCLEKFDLQAGALRTELPLEILLDKIRPGLTNPARFSGPQESAHLIRRQPAYSIKARSLASFTEAECMAAISTGIRNRKDA